MLNIENIKNWLSDCVFPVYCPGCKIFVKTETNLFACKNCLEKLETNSSFYCPSCLKRLPNISNTAPQKCSCAKKSNLDFLGFAADYQNPLVKELINNFKYRFAKKISSTLGYIFSAYLEKLPIKETVSDWLIIPIPLHKSRKNWRGFNQAEEIAKQINQKYNFKISAQNLIRIKNTSPQAEISGWQERKDNINLAFKVQYPDNLKNKNIILLDDVRASGATLEEAALVLKQAGVKTIIGLTVAK